MLFDRVEGYLLYVGNGFVVLVCMMVRKLSKWGFLAAGVLEYKKTMADFDL